jgi:hypothetical protein
MKAVLVWSSPFPERTIAVAMRRCYSTKTIEEIETELEERGAKYWKYLLTKALQDKSLDVLEHFTLSLLVEEMSGAMAGELARRFPYVHISDVGADLWLVSMNARTLVELWREPQARAFAELVVSELEAKQTCPVFSQVVFGEGADAR